MAPLTDKRLSDYLIPALLAAGVGSLAWLGLSVSDMAATLRVIVYRVDDHEARLDNIETLYLSKRGRLPP